MKRLISLILVVMMVVPLAACSSGVSQEESDKVVAEKDALQKQISSLEEKIESEESQRRKPSPTVVDETSKSFGDILVSNALMSDGVRISIIKLDDKNIVALSKNENGVNVTITMDETNLAAEAAFLVYFQEILLHCDSGQLAILSGNDFGSYSYKAGKRTVVSEMSLGKYDGVTKNDADNQFLILEEAVEFATNYIIK